jgi:hypothetical protein
VAPSVADKRFMDERVMYPELGLFIGGKWKMAPYVSRTGEVIDPSTGKPFATLPHAAKADLDDGLAAYAFTSSNATAAGIGDGGTEGLDAYLSVKFISQA